MPSLPQHFHLLAKPTGAVCNLDCTYCFFLSKEMLYPGSRFRMADELLETVHPAAARGAARRRGQHRLAGRRADADGARLLPARRWSYVEKHRRPGQRIANTIQTNGTLLDDEWCAFFKRAQLPRRPERRRAARRCTTPTASTRAASRRSTR